MSRPLFVLFITILVNLIGFGIIIPLLPFYAETFGASPFVVGLLFASFSVAQLISAPLLGEWSDRWGRRPVLILSLIGQHERSLGRAPGDIAPKRSDASEAAGRLQALLVRMRLEHKKELERKRQLRAG